MGFPETIGGWSKLTTTTLLGFVPLLTCLDNAYRNKLHRCRNKLKLYIIDGTDPVDITPIRLTSAGTLLLLLQMGLLL
jgi:hypothetical protein